MSCYETIADMEEHAEKLKKLIADMAQEKGVPIVVALATLSEVLLAVVNDRLEESARIASKGRTR
jgi:hypothetical protein